MGQKIPKTARRRFPNDIKIKARQLYISGLTVTAIAEKLNLLARTIRVWKQVAANADDDWDFYRSLNLQSSEEIVSEITESFMVLSQKLFKQIEQSNELSLEEKTNMLQSLSLSCDKMSQASMRSNPKINSLALALKIFSIQDEFIKSYYPRYLDVWVDIKEPLAQHLTKKIKK